MTPWGVGTCPSLSDGIWVWEARVGSRTRKRASSGDLGVVEMDFRDKRRGNWIQGHVVPIPPAPRRVI